MNIIFEHNKFKFWETDFILNNVLPKGKVRQIYSDNLEKIDTYDSEVIGDNAFIFSSRLHYFENVIPVLEYIKPKLIILLSDEFVVENRWMYNLCGNYCELFLRNYHHPNYEYTENTLHIPLGYTNGCKRYISFNKKYTWSFVGELKEDREEMISIFSKFENHFVGNKIARDKMCEIYSQSIFVPCGRGNSSLDCFRLYEASMNGAIPVVVGDDDEVNNTFKYEQNPPWIFAKSWKEAYNNCEDLLNDENQLKKMQINILSWWKNRMSSVRSRVSQVK
jgi:hypothetical protein